MIYTSDNAQRDNATRVSDDTVILGVNEDDTVALPRVTNIVDAVIVDDSFAQRVTYRSRHRARRSDTTTLTLIVLAVMTVSLALVCSGFVLGVTIDW
jgi:hypothetical protein